MGEPVRGVVHILLASAVVNHAEQRLFASSRAQRWWPWRKA